MPRLYHAHLFTHLSALLDYERLEGSEIVSDRSGVDSVYFTQFFFQSRSMSLEALRKYRLLLITFTCLGGILLSVKQPSESQKDSSVPKNQ